MPWAIWRGETPSRPFGRVERVERWIGLWSSRDTAA